MKKKCQFKMSTGQSLDPQTAGYLVSFNPHSFTRNALCVKGAGDGIMLVLGREL